MKTDEEMGGGATQAIQPTWWDRVCRGVVSAGRIIMTVLQVIEVARKLVKNW